MTARDGGRGLQPVEMAAIVIVSMGATGSVFFAHIGKTDFAVAHFAAAVIAAVLLVFTRKALLRLRGALA